MTASPSFPVLRMGPIAREDLARYAAASGDRNPLHLDAAAARASGFPDVIVHGMLALAALARVVTDAMPGGRLRSLDARFVEVTPVDSHLVCAVTEVAVASGLVTVSLEARRDDGAVTVRGEAIVDLGAAFR